MSASLPPGMPPGAGDPLRFAVETAAFRLLDRPVPGDPAGAALAMALLEYAAPTFATEPMADATWVAQRLREGLAALRGALGIAPAAAPQMVIDSMLAAHAAWQRGDGAAAAAALAPLANPGVRLAQALSAMPVPEPLRRALREARGALARQNISGGA